MPLVTLDDVLHAQSRLYGVVERTPVLHPPGLSISTGNQLRFKAENLQHTGAFKIRGAYNAIVSLPEEERRRGVITYSSGNHGQAVAYAASLLGLRAVVVMPQDAVPVKVEATKRWGAEVVLAGRTSLDRHEHARGLIEEQGYIMIPPFDDARIIAGQGTIGLEILDQSPDVEVVVVPVGGGGLISGIATAVKGLRPDVTIIGVEPAGAADAGESFRTGSLATWTHVETVADGLRTSRIGELNFATIRSTVDDMLAVPDDEILETVGILAREAKVVVEPSGAAAAAAVLFNRVEVHDRVIVAVLSGGNIDPAQFVTCLTPKSVSIGVRA